MRIGYVLKKFPRISETFILNEILELQRQGHRVTVISLNRPDDGVFHRQLADLAEPVLYLPSRKSVQMLEHLRAQLSILRAGRDGLWTEFEFLFEHRHPAPWAVLGQALDVVIACRQHGIEHLHAHFATIASHVARAAHSIGELPFSFTCHAKDIYRETVDPHRFRMLADAAEFVVTVCEANRRHIETELLGDASTRVMTLYNGVDLELQRPQSFDRSGPPIVLGVGRLVEKKGFEHLIRAAGSLLRSGAELRCMIVGDGEERPRLERAIAQQGVEGIELCGIKTQDEVRELMQRATLFVLPCIVGADGNRDALPTVLLEALACGVPCISTPVGGITEILADDVGVVISDVVDPATLAAEIARLLGDPAARARMAAAGREHAEARFDLTRNVAQLAEWFGSGVEARERLG